jgi:hypothetical protein
VGKRRETASLTQQSIRVGAWNAAAAAKKVLRSFFKSDRSSKRRNDGYAETGKTAD